jgi:Glycosyl transferases group 1
MGRLAVALRWRALRLRSMVRRERPHALPISLVPEAVPPRGRVLCSYLPEPLTWKRRDRRFDFHTNAWESRTVAEIFTGLGFAVDAVAWDDRRWVPRVSYDVVFDIAANLARWAGMVGSGCCLLLHRTECEPGFGNGAEQSRADRFEARTGVTYRPKRLAADVASQRRSLGAAHAVSLLGSEWTLGTYPRELHPKMTLIPVTASQLGKNVKPAAALVPPEREFLWFFGAGAVRKGLDLVLEAFARTPHLVLNVVGDVDWEHDFIAAYHRELYELGNVRFHGRLRPSGRRFGNILARCVALVAPACAEGASPAVATALQAGLYPIVSRETGITLPEGRGTWLERCEIAEIEGAVRRVAEADEHLLAAAIAEIRDFARERYSRAAFRRAMEAHLRRALVEHGRLKAREPESVGVR